jgi:hypothetical protein
MEATGGQGHVEPPPLALGPGAKKDLQRNLTKSEVRVRECECECERRGRDGRVPPLSLHSATVHRNLYLLNHPFSFSLTSGTTSHFPRITQQPLTVHSHHSICSFPWECGLCLCRHPVSASSAERVCMLEPAVLVPTHLPTC